MLLPHVGPGLFLRTGDLARYNALGELILLGREDFRVKIYGQLIAPEEIEHAIICASEQIVACIVRKESVVNVDGDSHDDEYWSCHVLAPNVKENQYVDLIRQLDTYCRQNLTSAMVPAAWKIYNQFPQLPSGKIDRQSFPKLERKGISATSVEEPASVQ